VYIYINANDCKELPQEIELKKERSIEDSDGGLLIFSTQTKIILL
jgi:hypothetical protein